MYIDIVLYIDKETFNVHAMRHFIETRIQYKRVRCLCWVYARMLYYTHMVLFLCRFRNMNNELMERNERIRKERTRENFFSSYAGSLYWKRYICNIHFLGFMWIYFIYLLKMVISKINCYFVNRNQFFEIFLQKNIRNDWKLVRLRQSELANWHQTYPFLLLLAI